MRILTLCGDLGIPLGGSKGASAHLRGLVAAFRGAGHPVSVVTSAPDDGADLGIPIVRVPAPLVSSDLEATAADGRRLARALAHVWNNVAVEGVLRDEIARERPDLIYERYSPFGAAGGIVARRHGIPHLLEVNAPLAREGTRYRHQALPEVAVALERSAFATAGRILAVSDELRRELVETGVPAEKIAVVPNGVDAELFAVEGPTQRAALVAPGELDDGLVVGFVGGLRPWHAVDDLAEAFRKLAADPRLRLLVLGDGPLARHVASLEADLPGRVTWLRAVAHAEVPAWVRAMDVAVAPYPVLDRFYFSPLKVLEYMATGRAVVASRIGQLGTLIRDGETGLLVPPGDPAALAGAIRRLADDAALRARLGQAAAAEIRGAHTWPLRAQQILALATPARTRAAPEGAVP